jgi:hypothetical protein
MSTPDAPHAPPSGQGFIIAGADRRALLETAPHETP